MIVTGERTAFTLHDSGRCSRRIGRSETATVVHERMSSGHREIRIDSRPHPQTTPCGGAALMLRDRRDRNRGLRVRNDGSTCSAAMRNVCDLDHTEEPDAP
jgi:hypothetical protein